MSKPWGGIGSWAAEAEAEEREEAAAAANAKSNNNSTGGDLQSFPSLKEAVTTKPKKKKMTLAEFNSGGTAAVSSRSQGLTPAEMFQLPTGPKQRAPDDYSGGRIGGGFSNYGGGRRDRDGDSDSSWGGRRSGFDDDRAPRRGSDYDLQPSRADEASDWGAGKKSMGPPSMDSGRSNRYDSLGAGSRADESQSWNLGKKPISPAAPPPLRSTTFGSGFRNSGTDSDRWKRGGEEIVHSDRPRLVLDPRKVEATGNEPPKTVANKANPFGAARPREDVLAEKGLDWKKIDSEIEAKKSVSSRPTSSQGSRPSSAHSSRSESTQPQPRPKVNPFGDAKPREVVLQEKGKDWRKMDLELEHRAIERPETEEEKALKVEIEELKKELEKEPSDPSQESGADQTSLHDIVQLKERELETLTRELDDKVRFSQKAVERPGSGAGRFGSFPDNRPPSRSGSVDDARSVDFVDRPRSRGTGDWARPGEDRRGSFHGSRDRGFMANRNSDMGNRNVDMGSGNFDRSATRERW